MLTKLIGKPTKDAFADAVIEALEKAGSEHEVEYEAEEFRLVVGESGYFNLHNVYEEYSTAGPLLRRTLLKRYASLIAETQTRRIPETFREAQANLLPRVRERSYHGIVRLQFQAEGLKAGQTPSRVLSDHLSVELAYDLPDSIATIDETTLGEWGVGLDLALDVARQNLLDGSPGRFDSPRRGVYVSAWNDHYDSSRIVLIELIRELGVEGDPVAMVPHRDVLIVTGSEDEKGLEKMAEITEATLSEARFMTAIPVRLQWDSWVPFEVPETHPLRPRFDTLRAQTILRDYDEQKTWLDKLHERTGEDVFVASYTATQNERSGEVTSYCVWSKDVVTLLPRADTVHFFDDDQPEEGKIVASAPWERVVEVAGNLMRRQDLCPPRFLVADFPSAEQVAQLNAEVASESP